MNLEKIYSHLPLSLQNLGLRIKSSRINKIRYSPGFHSLLDEYNSMSFFSEKEIREYRDKRLEEFCRIAGNNSFYKNSGICSFSNFHNQKILEKPVVKENVRNILNENGYDTIDAHTSGTTGSGLVFKTSLKALQEQFAVWWRYRMWHGISFGLLCGYFGGRRIVPISLKKPPFYRMAPSINELMFSGYHLNEETAKDYVEGLNKYRPAWLHGYPSMIALLASYIIDQNLKLELDVKWITIGTENLMPHQSNVIQKAFGVKPIQHYGQSEAVANISECPEGSLHVDEDFSYVEFEKLEGTQYKIIGTNFTNPVFPLVRYDTGDIVTITGKSCGCGRPGRVVDEIDGRSEDYIILKNGTRVGRLDHIFKDMVNIREAQIVQKEKGKIEVRVVKLKNYGSRDEGLLLKDLKSYLNDIEVDIVYTDRIEKTENNKLRFVVSDLTPSPFSNAGVLRT